MVSYPQWDSRIWNIGYPLKVAYAWSFYFHLSVLDRLHIERIVYPLLAFYNGYNGHQKTWLSICANGHGLFSGIVHIAFFQKLQVLLRRFYKWYLEDAASFAPFWQPKLPGTHHILSFHWRVNYAGRMGKSLELTTRLASWRHAYGYFLGYILYMLYIVCNSQIMDSYDNGGKCLVLCTPDVTV